MVSSASTSGSQARSAASLPQWTNRGTLAALPDGRPVTPAEGPGPADDPLLTIDEVIAELRVSRAAFYRWRRQRARRWCGRLASRLRLWVELSGTGAALLE